MPLTFSVTSKYPRPGKSVRTPPRLPAALLTIFLILSVPSLTHADVILSSNLSSVTAGVETASGTNYLAASFATDSSTYSLSSVTLLLAASSSADLAEVDLYSDDGYEPASLLATISASSPSSTTLAPQQFTASGLTLAANSTYWIVLKAVDTSSINWGWTSDDTGAGTGFEGQWSEYLNLGNGTSYWASSSDYPLRMEVAALAETSSIPEPKTFWLLFVVVSGFFAYQRLWPRRNFKF